MSSMGERIKELREKFGLTQIELAESMGYTTGRQVQRIESDKAKLDNEQIVFLAVLFDVTSDYLLGLSDDGTELQRNPLSAFPRHSANLAELTENRKSHFITAKPTPFSLPIKRN